MVSIDPRFAVLNRDELDRLVIWKRQYMLRLDEVFSRAELRRLAFARWLVTSGRLDEFADASKIGA